MAGSGAGGVARTLLGEDGEGSGHLQHHRRAGAWIQRAVGYGVPVVAQQHHAICTHTHTHTHNLHTHTHTVTDGVEFLTLTPD